MITLDMFQTDVTFKMAKVVLFFVLMETGQTFTVTGQMHDHPFPLLEHICTQTFTFNNNKKFWSNNVWLTADFFPSPVDADRNQ